MKKLIIIVVLQLIVYLQYAQNSFSCSTQGEAIKYDFNLIKKGTAEREECLKKIVRVNVHFILREDGTDNFTEVGDGNGPNTINGYDVAEEVIKILNYKVTFNPQLNIPPNNNIPTLPKDFSFFLEDVYFHRTDNLNNLDANFGVDIDNVMNVYFTYEQNTISGNASSTIIDDESISKHMTIYSEVGTPNSIDLLPGWYQISHTLEHEFGHLLGLNHTVRYNLGPEIPIQAMTYYHGNALCNSVFNSTDVNDYDNIADTPSPWEMYNTYGYTCHPACGWGRGNEDGCSNNLMDYAGSGHDALSPLQIKVIDLGLTEWANKRFLLCRGVAEDKTYCEFSFPKTKYFGDKIHITECSNGMGNKVIDKTKVYYNEEVVVDYLEVFANPINEDENNTFEILHICRCGEKKKR